MYNSKGLQNLNNYMFIHFDVMYLINNLLLNISALFNYFLLKYLKNIIADLFLKKHLYALDMQQRPLAAKEESCNIVVKSSAQFYFLDFCNK